MFRFANIEYFWLLLAALPLVGAYWLSARMRRRRLERFGDPETVRALMPAASPGRHFTKFLFFLAAFALAVTALARPQLGSKLREVKIEGMEMMLAVDVSNSMLAEDFAPNRLERTKYSIDRLLESLRQDRVGLVVFAGDAYVQLPITADYTTARNFVRQISPSMVSRQGTAIGAAIDLAASGFSSETEGSRAIIMITDGENHEDDAISAARAAAEKGIKIYTIGIGTPEGAPIPLPGAGSSGSSGSSGVGGSGSGAASGVGAEGDFIRDEEGQMVVSKLDEETLRQIAILTEGAYIRSTDQSLGLDEIVRRIDETESREFKAQMFEEYDEQYVWPLGGALFCVAVGWAILGRKNRLLARFNIFRKS
ncbi:MAG: VWA domain-containing protein [Alistipes sp.]|jgi:Ca-activated chloride channel family protein|nr:VWA domain-containing protein [Alistipes sp.]